MLASQGLSSADSREATGAGTPADALGVTKRMSTHDAESQESYECPTCTDTFPTRKAMKVHHARSHDETLSDVERTCEVCGDKFEVKPYRVRNGRGNFCSLSCFGEWQSEHNNGENNPAWKGETSECDNCGEVFHVQPHRKEVGWGRFCDNECYYEWLSDDLSGNGNPNWSGGYKDYYGPDWPRQRRRARDRDDHTCQACGIHEDDVETELSVHHIRPFRMFDSHEVANELNNLITLCRECHAKWEGIPLRPEVV